MLMHIPDLLNVAQLDKLREILSGARFVDGKLSAGMAASRVKDNEELAPEPELLQRLYRILMASVGHNAVFRSAALLWFSRRASAFPILRYEPATSTWVT